MFSKHKHSTVRGRQQRSGAGGSCRRIGGVGTHGQNRLSGSCWIDYSKRAMGAKNGELAQVPVTSFHLFLVCDGEYNDVVSTYKSLKYWIDLRSHYQGGVEM